MSYSYWFIAIFIILPKADITAANISCSPFTEGELNEIVYTWDRSAVNKTACLIEHNQPVFDLETINGILSYMCPDQPQRRPKSSENGTSYCQCDHSLPLTLKCVFYLMGDKAYLKVTWKFCIPPEAGLKRDTCNITFRTNSQEAADGISVEGVPAGAGSGGVVIVAIVTIVAILAILAIVIVWWKTNKCSQWRTNNPEGSARDAEQQTHLQIMTTES